ncbi:MAG: hydrogenase maturation protease [Verrucomicrobiota bacterium]|nr:hydrogenase maturation protease [Verrucomicrobiota bacterium]
MRTIIAGVGYMNLSDSSVGPLVVQALKQESWPQNVTIDDLSYGPISVMHNLNEASPRYDRMIVVTAADFGAPPPAMRWSRWSAPLPEAELVQRRIEEAVTGVIDWENLLVILQQFDVLPPETWVIAVQPVETEFGMHLSSGIAALLPEISRVARGLATGELSASAEPSHTHG